MTRRLGLYRLKAGRVIYPFIALLCCATPEAMADVYKYIDSNGHVSYTDRPNHSGFRRIIRTPPALLKPRLQASFNQTGLNQRFHKNREDFTPLIDAAANKYRLDPALLHAVIQTESAYNSEAVSDKGAAGLMQLMPGTASRYGVQNRFDPVENVDGGARYLSDLLSMFRFDVRLAVAAYNSGENTVKRFGYQIPPIAETQDYVVQVLNRYRR